MAVRNQLNICLLLLFSIFFTACSVERKLDNFSRTSLIEKPALSSAHVGICLYDASTSAFLYNYQSDKFFVPASNTKLFSLYAGMKYLGDSLVGVRYVERGNDILLLPAGDPTLLHPDFHSQPVIDFLKQKNRNIYIAEANWQDKPLGAGWSWDDYNDDYMVERSSLPVYGNFIRWVEQKQEQGNEQGNFGASASVFSVPDINWKVHFNSDTTARSFYVRRDKDQNIFDITLGTETLKSQDVPFITNGISSAIELLKDTLGRNIFRIAGLPNNASAVRILHSRPVDSLFKPMMFNSDNFFAEQTLLMVSNEKMGVMNDDRIIDSLLSADLKELPQKPHWVDGSGLSRFNLFTAADFVWLLNKMRGEFGIERIKRIFPTGGTGTLSGYYKSDSGYIFAKTGSLNGVICLSGYLYSKQNHLLIFSVLVNNHTGSPSLIRRSVEQYLEEIRRRF